MADLAGLARQSLLGLAAIAAGADRFVLGLGPQREPGGVRDRCGLDAGLGVGVLEAGLLPVGIGGGGHQPVAGLQRGRGDSVAILEQLELRMGDEFLVVDT